ncbi:MAG: PIN domain-containing protein [Gammaproteobacteria bacterium]|nr:PIN domain-containing protein [Gammaproteobacteria bacterium]
MLSPVCVVDTNIVVSGLIGGDRDSPPAGILNAMLNGNLLYLMSSDLLDVYSSVLRRPALVRVHRCTDDDIDRVLACLVANSMWREPTVDGDAPDSGDNHLWALLATFAQALLVISDGPLLDNPPSNASVMSPPETSPI